MILPTTLKGVGRRKHSNEDFTPALILFEVPLTGTGGQRCGMFYVHNRWLGGTLTNFATIRQSIERLRRIEEMENNPKIVEALTKKEMLGLRREKEKLEYSLGGIKGMKKLPDAIFVVDPKQEDIAVKEARKLVIPVVAVVDTNCDPDLVDHKIPGNDDAIRAIRLFCAAIADAVIEGKALYEQSLVKGKEDGKAAEPVVAADGGVAASS